VTLSSLLLLGISGGMVPCPAALVVLLAAITMHRIVFGLSLIFAFSIGLASVLILIGVLVVKSTKLMLRSKTEAKWLRILPVFSAGIIMLIGIGIAFNALLSAGIINVNFGL
jgi:ABC-type nickel/cobalt efflux system permease component RcnA